MDKLKKIWNVCGGYLFVILCGAVLVLFPNTAVALVTRALGAVLVAIGVYYGSKLLKGNLRSGWGWFFAVGGLVLGVYVLGNPLSLSDTLGRFFGLFLINQGVQDLRASRYDSAKFLAILTLVVGVLLVFIPRTLFNTMLAVVGIALIVIGVVNCADRLRHNGHLEEGNDPNIIDAEP